MYYFKQAGVLAAAIASLLPSAAAIPAAKAPHQYVKRANSSTPIAPKIFIISMFSPEAEVWYGISEFDVLAQNITVPGFSPLFPDAHCTADGQICQLTTGEAEINAASTISGLVLSSDFDLTSTYFMVAGIAGVNPEQATTGSVTFAKYAVQVALQYEFDSREIPSNWSAGYVPFGAYSPDEYPGNVYGTEVFELSESLRDMALAMATNATLNDTAAAAQYRALYANDTAYTAGASGPSIKACDVATSDVYYSGYDLSNAFQNATTLFTNGSGVYCTTAQEDNGTLEALLRGALQNLTDFSRIIVMRTASDFDRPPPGVSDIDNLLYVDQGGFEPAITNIYRAGINVVMGIVNEWNSTFSAGIPVTNYIGDIFNSLGGDPDYGIPGSFINPTNSTGNYGRKRSLPKGMKQQKRQPVVQGNARMRKKTAALKRAAATKGKKAVVV